MHQHHPGHNHANSPIEPPSRGIKLGILAILLVTALVAFLAPRFLPSFSTSTAEDGGQAGDSYYLAKVLEASDISDTDPTGTIVTKQSVTLRFNTGPLKGSEKEIENGATLGIYKDQRVAPGQTVVVIATENHEFYIYDKYRLTPLLWLFAFFLSLAAWFGRIKGLASIAGLVVSVGVLGGIAIPLIVGGSSPLIVSALSAGGIAVIALYLAHGFNKRTTIALLSVLMTLGITTLLALLFVKFAYLYGLGSEEAFYLQIDSTLQIDLRGLLLGGIIIGTLGVLDDVTTVQVATVAELKHLAPHLSFTELYRRGINVGTEHIASLVNTLALAYVGVSFPLLLLFTVNSTRPAWVTVNSEVIAEEIVRTIIGSMALVLAVPISTALAAYFLQAEDRA